MSVSLPSILVSQSIDSPCIATASTSKSLRYVAWTKGTFLYFISLVFIRYVAKHSKNKNIQTKQTLQIISSQSNIISFLQQSFTDAIGCIWCVRALTAQYRKPTMTIMPEFSLAYWHRRQTLTHSMQRRQLEHTATHHTDHADTLSYWTKTTFFHVAMKEI